MYNLIVYRYCYLKFYGSLHFPLQFYNPISYITTSMFKKTPIAYHFPSGATIYYFFLFRVCFIVILVSYYYIRYVSHLHTLIIENFYLCLSLSDIISITLLFKNNT